MVRFLMVFAALVMILRAGVPISVAQVCDAQAEYTDFGKPEQVMIEGYNDHAMEPFLSRDGEYLLFNNRNDPSVDTNIHWARRVDDLTFEYMGEVGGIATDYLEGVPTMDAAGVFYFVSPRSYGTTFSTIYSGQFAAGVVTGVKVVAGVSLKEALMVNFDVEVSADGNRLYFVDARFNPDFQPETADLVIAERRSEGFARLLVSEEWLAHVNSAALEYAAAISADERELFFTRVDIEAINPSPQIYRASRDSVNEAFGCPARVVAIDGFVEGPAFSADEQALYYHRLEDGRFVLYRVAR